MSEYRESVTSDGSSTLSEFVRRRYNGDVPVFGGDPKVGAAEFGASVSNTVNTQFISALVGINDTLKKLNLQSRVASARAPVEQVKMRDNDPSQDEMDDAMDLDDEKVRFLLDASVVSTKDVAKYFALITVAREGLKKKKSATEVAQMRKAAALRVDFLVPDLEINIAYSPQNRSAVERYIKEELGITDKTGIALLKRAFVHESRFSGRSTNRPLALVGDAAMALLLKEQAYASRVTVGDASGILQATQNNAVLRDIGIKYGFDRFICAGVNIDVTSRSVMATTVEAVFGAVYQSGGMEALRVLNRDKIVVCDFTELFVKRSSVPEPAVEQPLL